MVLAGGGGGGSGRDGWVNNKGEADKPPHVPGGGGKASDNDGSNQKGNTEAGIDGLRWWWRWKLQLWRTNSSFKGRRKRYRYY